MPPGLSESVKTTPKMPPIKAESYLMMPGGQSDHPLSPFHGAGHDDWVRGRPTPLLPGAAAYRLTLQP